MNETKTKLWEEDQVEDYFAREQRAEQSFIDELYKEVTEDG
jgi:hypothetical protein|tara:strand:- start:183 stop:305 length:123 start_codon:yes stop_codon:yes gene_type:complete